MEDDREKQIRRRAYELWESEERPQGEDIRHWMQAAQEVEADEPPPIAASRDGPDADALLNGAGEAGILESSRNENGPVSGGDIPEVEITTRAKPVSRRIRKTEFLCNGKSDRNFEVRPLFAPDGKSKEKRARDTSGHDCYPGKLGNYDR